MAYDPQKPYDDLPDLPPVSHLQTEAVLKRVVETRVAVERFRSVASYSPCQGVLMALMPIIEAQAASEIENIVTTTENMFLRVSGVKSDAMIAPATKEALHYQKALYHGYSLLKKDSLPVSTRMAVEVVGKIKGSSLNIRRSSGTYLKNQKGHVVYTPPVGEKLIRDKLANWEKYIHDHEEVDPLIRLAVMHYQFEAIHPFIDGNGRTGRVLNLLYLVEKGLLDQPALYLSGGILRSRSDYYQFLREVTSDAKWEQWILYMLAVVKDVAEDTVQKIKGIEKLMQEVKELIKARRPRIYSRDLVDIIFSNPFIRVKSVVQRGLMQRQAALRNLRFLCEEGVLHTRNHGHINLFVNHKLLDFLEKNE